MTNSDDFLWRLAKGCIELGWYVAGEAYVIPSHVPDKGPPPSVRPACAASR